MANTICRLHWSWGFNFFPEQKGPLLVVGFNQVQMLEMAPLLSSACPLSFTFGRSSIG